MNAGILAGVAAVLLAALIPATPARASDDFPLPESLEPAVRFWTHVFTQINRDQGTIHDTRRLDLIYDVLEFHPEASRAERSGQARAAKRRYRAHLLALAAGDTPEPGTERARVRSLWPHDATPRELRAAAGRLRFQRGLSDTMRAGVIRAGAWQRHIVSALARDGVPGELIALPLLEAAYDPWTYSHADALGLWQFIPSTGRRFLRIDRVVDERLHLESATRAAAALLLDYHAQVGSWPLTLTAYNHGNGGVLRAIAELGTRDIATIVARYDGPRFGFASRNYYASFLAALDVFHDAEQYFGPIAQHAPEQVERVVMSEPMPVERLELELGIARDRLRYHNPALMAPVWTGAVNVPRGYELRVPLRDILGVPMYDGQVYDASWPLRDVSMSVRAPRPMGDAAPPPASLKALEELLW